MDSRDQSRPQCKWLNERLHEMARRLLVIQGRMKARGFPHDDKRYHLVSEAFNAVWRAEGHAHVLCCQGQMGTTYFFRGDDGIGRTEPSSESPQPHNQPQPYGNQRRAD
jgi:hypothetical protein